MNFKYLRHKEINFRLWDECIENSVNGNIYGLSWYLDILSPNWDGIVEEVDGRYLSIFPVTKAQKFGISYVKGPIFCHQLGLFSERISEEKIKVVFEVFRKKIRVCSHYPLNINSHFINYGDDILISPKKTFQLDLNIEYQKIWMNYKSDRREKLKRAQKRGVIVSRSNNFEDLVKLFKENVEHKVIGGVTQYQYKLLKELYIKSKNEGLGFLMEARDSSGILAISFFYKFKNTISYFFSATSTSGRKNNASEAIIDYVIKEYSNSNLVFDFAGSEIPGLIEFFSRFGSTEKNFFDISFNNSFYVVKVLQGIRKRILIGDV